MKYLKVITALAIGIMASTSGVVQVEAGNRFFFVDYATKEVANFTPYTQSFNDATSSLGNSFKWTFSAQYKLDSCVGITTSLNANFNLSYRVNSGSFSLITKTLPDLPCTTTYTNYNIFVSGVFPVSPLAAVVDDDANYLDMRPVLDIVNSAPYFGRTLDFVNVVFAFDFYYDFNTTYLFNTFLSDSKLEFFNGGAFTFPTATSETFLEYVYTQAGNDIDTIYNDPGPANIGTTRKKYAIDFSDVFFRGERIGLRYGYLRPDMRRVLPNAVGTSSVFPILYYYYFNVSNYTQPLVDAPIFEFEEEDCGDFLSLNVGCFINNAFAYITNDAPIVSDAFTLLNAGIEMAAQTFGIIGNFADDNVFGVLILAGFGFIAVKWFLKND
jgi:hypothetical protein